MKSPLLILAALAALFALPLLGQVPSGSIGITVKNAGPGSSVLWLPPTPDHVLGLDEEGTWTVKEAGASASTFLALTDTPASYDGHAWKSVRVNPTGDGLEFFTPAMGSGTELQFRNGGFFGAVANSSVTGGRITLGGAESLGVTPTAYLTLRNASSASAGAQQVSPSLVWEGRGWRTNTAASSQEVRFRANVLPVQGAANPSATWRMQSESNNSGTWVDALRVTSGGVSVVNNLRVGDENGANIRDGFEATGDVNQRGRIILATTDAYGIQLASAGGNWSLLGSISAGSGYGSPYWQGGMNINSDTLRLNAAAHIVAIYSGSNAQTLRVHNTWTSESSHESFVADWRAQSNVVRVGTVKGAGGGTARAMSLVTDGANRLTIDALGRIIPVLPTSAAGLPTGALWNDAGTVKVAP